MIEDFNIQLERVDMYLLGSMPVFKPWIWRCTFIGDGKRMVAAFLQDSDARDPRQAAQLFEQAIQEFI